MEDYEQNQIVGLVEKCYSEAANSRTEQIQIESPFPGNLYIETNPWPIFQAAYENKTWTRMGVQPGWKSRPSRSKSFQITESMATFITDNRAKAMFLPAEVNDAMLANKVQAAWNHWLSAQSYDITQTLTVLDSRKFGLGWLYLRYDSKRKEQVVEVVHPESILVDPDCTADSYLKGDGPTYLIHEKIVQFGELEAAYPDKIDRETFNTKWVPAVSSASWYDRVLKYFWPGRSDVDNPAVSVPVYELWIRDPEEVVFEQDMGELVVTKKKKKYKGGRRIVVAGGIVLEDGSNPYKHGEFPFTPILAYPESGKFYCSGDIQRVLPLEIMGNRMVQLLFDSTVKAGGGILWLDSRQVKANMITNDVMQVVEVKDPSTAGRFDRFPAPSRHVFDFLGLLDSDGDDVGGSHDISRGTYTPGNKTAQEIVALTESDKTRVRKATRWLGWANERVARQWLSNAAQWKDWEWFLRIAGDDGEEIPVTLNGSELRRMDGEEGEEKLSSEAIKFDITIADSSTLPTYFQERKQTALELFQMGVIDTEALLENLEFPGWRAILARMAAAPPPPAEPGMDAGMGMPPDMGMAPPPVDPMMAAPPPVPDDEALMAIEMMAEQLGIPPEQVMEMIIAGEMPMP